MLDSSKKLPHLFARADFSALLFDHLNLQASPDSVKGPEDIVWNLLSVLEICGGSLVKSYQSVN